jgi:hypothetical protein
MTIFPSHAQENDRGNVDQINMSDPRYLDLTVNQVQDNICLTNIPDPRHLAVRQVRGNVRLINMLDPRHLDLVFPRE